MTVAYAGPWPRPERVLSSGMLVPTYCYDIASRTQERGSERGALSSVTMELSPIITRQRDTCCADTELCTTKASVQTNLLRHWSPPGDLGLAWTFATAWPSGGRMSLYTVRHDRFPRISTCSSIYQHRSSNPFCEALIQAQYNVAKREGGRETAPKKELKPFTFPWQFPAALLGLYLCL